MNVWSKKEYSDNTLLMLHVGFWWFHVPRAPGALQVLELDPDREYLELHEKEAIASTAYLPPTDDLL